jgi:tetratricopeptide (TPR) repeat protein
MHRYDELEKRYYRNKIKKYLIFFISLIILSLSSYYAYKKFFTNEQKSAKIKVNFKKIINQTSQNKNEINKHYEETKHEINSTKKPSAVTNEINETKKTYKENNLTNKTSVKKEENKSEKKESLTPNLSFVVPEIKKDVPEISDKNKIQKKVSSVQNEKNLTKKTNKTVTIKIIPKIKEEPLNINDLIQSFKQYPQYDTAMAISNYYFEKKDYNNAKLWALKANNINPAKYKSWKMFAMILLKKNDKIQAKKVLKIYLDDYGDNDEIEKLLRSIDE